MTSRPSPTSIGGPRYARTTTVRCPVCRATVGQRCRRRTRDVPASRPHRDRKRLALQAKHDTATTLEAWP